ncbi:MAG: D-cysteine desulfhydrase family protein, partial [Thermovirgaceae bacterium]
SISGNKIRKLEFTTAEALAKGADTLITCGGAQSNHARATAAVAARLGLKCHLVLGGPPEPVPDGNLFLDMLFGATVTFAPEAGLLELEEEMKKTAEAYREEGGSPYIVPLGASDPIGSLGYVAAAWEIAAQSAEDTLDFDWIVIPAGSAGTLAGLAAGIAMADTGSTVCGFSVSFPEEWLLDKVDRLCQGLRDSYFPSLDTRSLPVRVFDGYVGEGYGKTTPEELRFIRDVASRESILLDPVYTGKALHGLASEIWKGTFKKGEKILFIHTGGVFGLFPYREAFRENVFSL